MWEPHEEQPAQDQEEQTGRVSLLTKRDLNKISSEEWSVLIGLVRDQIDYLDRKISMSIEVMLPDKDGNIAEDNDDKLRYWHEDRALRNFYVILKEKIEWLVANEA